MAALERAEAARIGRQPGQAVAHVVVDDSKTGRDRVQLPHEEIDGYDASFYTEQLVRAAESVVAPLEWRTEDIEAHLADRVTPSIHAFTE